MNHAPMKPCAHGGCGARVPLGTRHCPAHQRESRQLGDAQRGSSTQRGYDYKWQRFRDAWLDERPLCGDRDDGPSAEHSACVRAGRITAGTQVDHIRRIREAPHLRLDRSNVQTLCDRCHAAKTAVERAAGGRGSNP